MQVSTQGPSQTYRGYRFRNPKRGPGNGIVSHGSFVCGIEVCVRLTNQAGSDDLSGKVLARARCSRDNRNVSSQSKVLEGSAANIDSISFRKAGS